MTRRKKVFFYKCLLVLITYFIIELGCFISIRSGYIPAREPTFNFVLNNPKYPSVNADINPVWGTWHYKEPYRAQVGCLFLNYQINSYGARDKERIKKSNDRDRVIVLGDSFMEGYGVEVNNRLSALLEHRTGHEFLNFACSDFGTTQEYLVYDHLAKDFDHSTILIGFLPFNDFQNDDLAFSESDRYKPYFVKYDSGYKLEYHADALEKSRLNEKKFHASAKTIKTTIVRFLRSYTWWFNIVDFIKDKKLREYVNKNKDGQVLSYYYDYKPEQLDKLKYILSIFRRSAGDKKIVFFTIPVLPDFIRNEKIKNPILPAHLKTICDSLNIEYVDLMQPFLQKEQNYRKFFLACDPHWNEFANQTAADILISYLQGAKKPN